MATATAVLCFQLAIMVSPTPGESHYQTGDQASRMLLWGNPTNVMRRLDPWNWSNLRELTLARGLGNPAIAYLGGGGGLTAPQIGSPWVMANEEVQVRWLWRFEDGPLDWNKVMASVNASNVVITALDVVGSLADKQDIDNQYNAELIRRLQNNPEFAQPIELKLGQINPARVIVFLRKPESKLVTAGVPQPKLPEYLF